MSVGWCKYIVVIRYLVTLQYAISRVCYVHWYPSLFSLFVCGFSSNFRIFHTYGDVTITGEGLQIFTYARHLWPLSREGSLACHTYCDKSHLFLMVISEDPWHSHLLNSVWQKSCHYLILDLCLSRMGFEHPTFRFWGERSTMPPLWLSKSKTSSCSNLIALYNLYPGTQPHNLITIECEIKVTVENFIKYTTTIPNRSLFEIYTRLLFVRKCHRKCKYFWTCK